MADDHLVQEGKRGKSGTQKGKGKPCAAAFCQERQCSPLIGLLSTAAGDDYSGKKDDFRLAFPSHCLQPGWNFMRAQKFLPAALAGQRPSKRHR